MKFFENANFPFIRNRRIGYVLSISLFVVSIAVILLRGLQYSIDFKGGTELVAEFQYPVSVEDVRKAIDGHPDSEFLVRYYGSEREVQIRSVMINNEEFNEWVESALKSALPGNEYQIVKVDAIGPVFAEDMREAALIACILSIIVIVAYIFTRFKKISFSMAILMTLVHDLVIILGVLTLLDEVLSFNLDIDQNMIAALLTIIGYSLNDTIVVFDRVRENQNIHKGKPWEEIVNTSINQTLSRTVVTSLTTLLVVAVLFFFGGATLKGFSFAMVIGVVLGTYSTICISCPIIVDIQKNRGLKPVQTEKPVHVKGTKAA